MLSEGHKGHLQVTERAINETGISNHIQEMLTGEIFIADEVKIVDGERLSTENGGRRSTKLH